MNLLYQTIVAQFDLLGLHCFIILSSLVVYCSKVSRCSGFVMLLICDTSHFLRYFYSPLQVPELCRRLILLRLDVDLMVASIFVGSYMLLLFFYVPLLLFSLTCNFPLLDTISVACYPFSLGFPSFVWVNTETKRRLEK